MTANPRIAALGFQRTTGGQLDDDLDGFGNHCDADFNNLDGITNPIDLSPFKTASGKKRSQSVCGVGGTEPCAQYDVNGADGLVNPNDLARFRELSGTKKNKKEWVRCAACPLP